MQLNGVFHPSKIGDMIYSLPAVYLRGGTKRFISSRKSETEYIKPLFEAQPYIDYVGYLSKPDSNIDLDFSSYQALYKLFLRGNLVYMNLICAGIRTHHFPLKIDSVELHSTQIKYGNIKLDLMKYRDIPIWNNNKAWITNIDPKSEVDILINVSGRYHDYALNGESVHNPMKHFDYTLLKEYNTGFVGFDDEYQNFIDRYNFKPKRIEVKNALETAQYIRGSKLFVGNCSSAKAIAEGLKHPFLMEISKDYSDDLPMGKNGHVYINKEIIEYYLDQDPLEDSFPDIEYSGEKKENTGLGAFFS